MFHFSKTSKEKLKTVDDRLQKLFLEAINSSPYDFKITEGIRSIDRQRELVKKGYSRTMKSYHLVGKAVDIAVIIDEKITWDFKYYKAVSEHIKKIAKDMKLKITWGGDWKSIVDGPHFQLELK